MITTIELRTSSVRDGQETLFISASTAIKKSANAGMFTSRNASHSPDSEQSPTGTAYCTDLPQFDIKLHSLNRQQPDATVTANARKGHLPGNAALAAFV